MYDIVKSTFFGIRNADKVINTSDKGRIFADLGQLTNAVKATAKLDNAVGKGAQAAIDAMETAAKSNKVLDSALKGANWASKNINPLLVGAAGYRVCIADDKEQALKREIYGMSSMFAAEAGIKALFASQAFANIEKSMPNKKAAALFGIGKALAFIVVSMTGSSIGYKLGDYFFGPKEEDKSIVSLKGELNHKTNAIQANKHNNKATNPHDIDRSEYFALDNNKTALA